MGDIINDILVSLGIRKKDKNDWRNTDLLPQEVLTKKELDDLQKEVLDELDKLQVSTIERFGATDSDKPQTLFYYHKYIDSKFNKNEFDVETFYAKKQDIIDKKYAEGLGDVNAEFTGYKELIEEIKEVDQRLRRKTNKLDPESNIDIDLKCLYDDSDRIEEQIKNFSNEIDWAKLEESK